MAGKFIISLDFELHWGAAERWDLNVKKKYFNNTREAITEMLKVFENSNVKATWATVGFLFASSKKELKSFLPQKKPDYHNRKLNYYQLLENGVVGESEKDDPYHFAQSIIKEILKYPGQELASHTFCHYYCNEEGQTAFQFNQDLEASQNISKNLLGLQLSSLVFPRNQFRQEYLSVLKKNSYRVVRTNPDVWFWKYPVPFVSLFRAFDTMLPISTSLAFSDKEVISIEGILLLPASRFFRPYSHKERFFQNLKLKRIKSEMSYAAKKGYNYHLWWHPHNFGNFPRENLAQLNEILSHFKMLEKKFDFRSVNMGDYAEKLS